MLKIVSKQLSLHSILYNKIPENHILKKINSIVDFDFINTLLEDSYCKNFGRPAKEPELMCKLLFLQHLYNLSDEAVIREANLNLAYMYFLGLNPEDSIPNKTLLSKFRNHRLKESTLDDIIMEIVRQCVEKGIITCKSISVDATHIEANTIKKSPEKLMSHLAKKIINTYENETNEKLEDIEDSPNYKALDDYDESRKVMKDYLEAIIEKIESEAPKNIFETQKVIDQARDMLSDNKFLKLKGSRSLVDLDARVGHKSKTKSFFGYKTEFTMTTEERIITAVITGSGAYMDGSHIEKLLDQNLKAGVEIEGFFGDKAYFRKKILNRLEDMNARAFIPVSAAVYRIDENEFSYNKDSDQWMCSEGNITEKKKYHVSKCKDGPRESYKYYFNLSQCKACSKHDQCAKRSARKILNLGLNTGKFYVESQYQKTEEFKKLYKKRASIEGKNAELKRFHGLCRARGYSLSSVDTQAKLAAIAVNLKRISALISSFFTKNLLILQV